MAVRSLFAATAASLFVLARANDYPPLPPCTVPFAPFDFVGCFTDDGNHDTLPFATNLNFYNMTIELCIATCKGNDFRYAGLEYYGQCYCGDSVSGSQVDDGQCTYACSGNSSETCGGSSLIDVYMDPTFNPSDHSTTSDYVSQGCYSEGTNGRALNFEQTQLNASVMTTELCLQTCKDQNYPLAGTEFASQCFCGVILGNGSAPAAASSCSMACNGNSSETCGGPNFLNLYAANDLEEQQPCGYTPPATTMMTTSTTTSSSTTSTTTSRPRRVLAHPLTQLQLASTVAENGALPPCHHGAISHLAWQQSLLVSFRLPVAGLLTDGAVQVRLHATVTRAGVKTLLNTATNVPVRVVEAQDGAVPDGVVPDGAGSVILQ
ncbi:MAG: hypothetical protein MMC33_002403 [Icmadophila ericetorum]|nr:hypothetical protein [Icmadophila ericetorum]